MIVRNYNPSMMLGISCFILPKQHLQLDFHSFTCKKGSPYPASTGAWAPRPLIGGPWRASSGPMRTCDVGQSDNRIISPKPCYPLRAQEMLPGLSYKPTGPVQLGFLPPTIIAFTTMTMTLLMRGRPQVTRTEARTQLLITSFTSAKFQR